MVFSTLIEQAIELAAQWHAGTHRKGGWRPAPFEVPAGEALPIPVIAHVTTVAMTVQRAGFDEVAVAAAFLHDVLEDENRYGQSFRREQLRALLGPDVLHLVEFLTEQKRDAEGGWLPWRPRKEAYVARLRQGPPDAAAISLADKLHNLWSVNESLEQGIDVFQAGPNRRPLSAGPPEQRWFYAAVMAATAHHEDPRLVPLRARLLQEIQRFEANTGVSEK